MKAAVLHAFRTSLHSGVSSSLPNCIETPLFLVLLRYRLPLLVGIRLASTRNSWSISSSVL